MYGSASKDCIRAIRWPTLPLRSVTSCGKVFGICLAIPLIDQVSVVESNCFCIIVNAVGIKNDEQKAAQAAMLLQKVGSA